MYVTHFESLPSVVELWSCGEFSSDMKGAALLCQLTWHGRHGHGHGRAKSLRERERAAAAGVWKFFVFNCSTVNVIVTNIFFGLQQHLKTSSMISVTNQCIMQLH